MNQTTHFLAILSFYMRMMSWGVVLFSKIFFNFAKTSRISTEISNVRFYVAICISEEVCTSSIISTLFIIINFIWSDISMEDFLSIIMNFSDFLSE